MACAFPRCWACVSFFLPGWLGGASADKVNIFSPLIITMPSVLLVSTSTLPIMFDEYLAFEFWILQFHWRWRSNACRKQEMSQPSFSRQSEWSSLCNLSIGRICSFETFNFNKYEKIINWIYLYLAPFSSPSWFPSLFSTVPPFPTASSSTFLSSSTRPFIGFV